MEENKRIEKKSMNARFWEYINDGWVKLTLRPDQELSWHRSGTTEEGVAAESYRWRYDKHSAVVFCNYMADGTDCDGRLTRFWTGSFDINRFTLDAKPCIVGQDKDGNPIIDKTILTPDWRECDSSQRDYVAEAMGY